MSHPLFETVRQRYRQSCGYCGVTETTVGGELTLDHYQPHSAGGSDELDNLVYACIWMLDERLAANARRPVEQRYDWDAIGRRFAALVGETATARRPLPGKRS